MTSKFDAFREPEEDAEDQRKLRYGQLETHLLVPVDTFSPLGCCRLDLYRWEAPRRVTFREKHIAALPPYRWKLRNLRPLPSASPLAAGVSAGTEIERVGSRATLFVVCGCFGVTAGLRDPADVCGRALGRSSVAGVAVESGAGWQIVRRTRVR